MIVTANTLQQGAKPVRMDESIHPGGRSSVPVLTGKNEDIKKAMIIQLF